jgi:two-component system LytT family response regulator
MCNCTSISNTILTRVEEHIDCNQEDMNKKFSVVIIDDEAKARRIMETLIQEHCPQLQIVDMADDVLTGVKAIQKHKPDIVFLDIEMPGYTGFQLLDFFDDIQFNVIFATAYSEYALQAFQVSAVDYLLKPIQIDQLQVAVEKAIRLANNAQTKERVSVLKENLENKTIKKIALPMSHGLTFVPLVDILYLEADGSYTHVFLKDGSKLLISKKIKDFEQTLHPENRFFRTHRSFIVNLDYISQYVKQDGGHVVMENNAVIQIARDRKEEFNTIINQDKI